MSWKQFALLMASFLPFTLLLGYITGDPNAVIGNVLAIIIFVPFIWFCERL